jgi:hypothetical protein
MSEQSVGKGLLGDHPDKHIREAIEYAERQGWRVTGSSGRAHVWGTIWCPLKARDGCRFRVYSTPASPEHHAKDIRRAVDRCTHEVEEETE